MNNTINTILNDLHNLTTSLRAVEWGDGIGKKTRLEIYEESYLKEWNEARYYGNLDSKILELTVDETAPTVKDIEQVQYYFQVVEELLRHE